MARDLVILGDGPFAEIAYEYFTHDSDHDVVAFSVEEKFRRHDILHGLPVVPFERLEREYDPVAHMVYAAIVFTQLNRLRTRLATAAKAKGFTLASYVSSRASVWRNVELGEHCFVFENVIVEPFVRIGANCVLWAGCHVAHHSTVHDNVFVAAEAAITGDVVIGESSFVGLNATVVDGITVGRDNWIGAGVVVTRDAPAGTVWRPPHSERRPGTALDKFGLSG